MAKDQVNKEQEEMAHRVQLFDQELRDLQNKYKLRLVAQYIFPGGLTVSLPIQVFPMIPQMPPAPDQASRPE